MLTAHIEVVPLAWAIIAAAALAGTARAQAPVPIIFDTDIQGDVDDVGAITVLHALAARGEAEILAMGVSAKHPACVPCLSALNVYFGRSDIPIGVVKGEGFRRDSKYNHIIAEEFPHELNSADEAPDAALVYREALAGRPDGSVVVVSVGQITNLRNLLQTEGDEHSTLTGAELVRQKVRAWVCMGAKIPEGQEANLIHDGPAAQYAIENWPTPIVFSGWEIGRGIQTGGRFGELPSTSPVRRSYELYKDGIKPHNSYDQTAVLYAVRGLGGGLADVWDLGTAGYLHVFPDGANEWRPAPDKEHSYLKVNMPPAKVAEIIEELMLYQPGE